uniref:Uncharacterized protein TCIL3000_7_3150 n=1 Tax=Trypanosoma congolense (strain IL3000) TaxID=1068625 RepID=G0UQ40_TRYCI|nr:unnamed protein product [Trypanosoma congolense IL3000]
MYFCFYVYELGVFFEPFLPPSSFPFVLPPLQPLPLQQVEKVGVSVWIGISNLLSLCDFSHHCYHSRCVATGSGLSPFLSGGIIFFFFYSLSVYAYFFSPLTHLVLMFFLSLLILLIHDRINCWYCRVPYRGTPFSLSPSAFPSFSLLALVYILYDPSGRSLQILKMLIIIHYFIITITIITIIFF